jgi:hypothetical protein
MVSTYGTWLPGDDRGWHERNHHEHVDGDYHHPIEPTNFSRGRWQHSKDVMRFDPFYIEEGEQARFGSWLLESFYNRGVLIAALAVATTNFHALVRYEGLNCKVMLGRVKADITVRWTKLVETQGGRRRPIWGGGSLPKPIRDEKHGHAVFKYILDHQKQRAWVWSHRDARH